MACIPSSQNLYPLLATLPLGFYRKWLVPAVLPPSFLIFLVGLLASFFIIHPVLLQPLLRRSNLPGRQYTTLFISCTLCPS